MAAAALAGCATAETQEVAVGTPACENLDHTKNIETQEDSILACAKELNAAGAFESGIPGTFDKRWLDEPQQHGPPHFNCIGTIWPEKRAHMNDITDVGPFQNGGGRVTAKILIEQSPGAGSCRFYRQGPLQGPPQDPPQGPPPGTVHLYPGISYVFVYDLGEEDEHSKKPARVVIVHEDGSLPPGQQFQNRPIRVCWHPTFGYQHAHGRWQMEPVDVKGGWTCVNKGCCNMP